MRLSRERYEGGFDKSRDMSCDPSAGHEKSQPPARSYPVSFARRCSSRSLTAGHSLSSIEKTTVSRRCPVQVRVSRRSIPSLTAPSFATAAWLRSLRASTVNCTRTAPELKAWPSISSFVSGLTKLARTSGRRNVAPIHTTVLCPGCKVSRYADHPTVRQATNNVGQTLSWRRDTIGRPVLVEACTHWIDEQDRP